MKSAQAVVAALRFKARDKRQPDPVGPRAEMALAGFTRADRSDRGRGQALALTIEDMAATAAAAALPPEGRAGC